MGQGTSFMYATMLNPGPGTESGHWDGNALDPGSNRNMPGPRIQEPGLV